MLKINRLPANAVWEREKLSVFGLFKRILQSKSGMFGEKFNKDGRKTGDFTASNAFRRKSNNAWLFGLALLGLVLACGNQPTPKAEASLTVAMAPADTIAPTLLVSKEYLLGKFDPATHPDFVTVGKPYTDKPGMMLRKEAFEAFQKMWESARKDGVTLRIISSTRTFEQQKAIWEGKWSRFAKDAPEPLDRARKILEYSSMPGSSRHHWGTDIDLNDLNNPSFEAGGLHEKVYAWLSAHAHEFGFCQPYTPGRAHGYQEEKWHWSYMPLSKPFLQQYRQTMSNADIQGFQGATLAAEVKAVEHYVLGIGELCMPE